MRAAPVLALGALLLLWPSGRSVAQVGGGGPADTLDAVEAALDSGRVERARRLLGAWVSAREEPPADRRGRALFLRARLTADPDSAEALYLDLAMAGDPGYGGRAWLRLAQLHLARGETARARSELERLRADYPGSEVAARSWYWTGMAAARAGDRGGACRAWERATGAGGGAAELAARAVEGCRAGADPTAGAPGEGDPAGGPEGDDRPAAATSGFAVQLGAFREGSGARALAERAREAGFEVRTVGPAPGDGLFRVRTRTVPGRGEAAELVRRLQAEGLPAMVVRIEESSREVKR